MNHFNSDKEIYHCICDAQKMTPEKDHREEDAVFDCIIVFYSPFLHEIEGIRA